MNKNFNLIQWFIGFADAEGSFTVYPKVRKLKSGKISKVNIGYSFHLSLHLRDKPIIVMLHKLLGDIGTIYQYKNKLDIRLAINSKRELLTLFKIFDNYSLLTKHQLSNYLVLKHILTQNTQEFKTEEEYHEFVYTVKNNVNEIINAKYNWKTLLDYSIWKNWIIGFINGEGSFYLNKGRCVLYIEHTDKLILEFIKYKLDFGPNVVKRGSRLRDIGKNIKQTYVLNISSKKDINTIVSFLDDKYNVKLQGEKLNQYNEWKNNLK